MVSRKSINNAKTSLIKSKERKRKFAEVFTPEHIVKKMVSLVDENFTDEEYLHKTWFDPAVGTGNFPAEILKRKLDWCKKHNYTPKQSLEALATIYGVDIQEDNVKETRERLFKIWRDAYENELQFMKEGFELCLVAMGILALNIIIGDTITYPEKIHIWKFKFDETGEMTGIKVCTLADMLGEEGMKDVLKRRKALEKRARDAA